MNGRFYVSFCLRDAMLAWYWLSPSVCPSVCLSVTRRHDVETAGRIELVFGVKAIVGLSYTVLQGNLAKSKITGTYLWNFSPTLDLEQFRHGTSTVASVVNLVRPTTVASLSHWASSVVYNTMGSTQRTVRVCLRQLRLVIRVGVIHSWFI